MTKTKKITTSAVLIALSSVLMIASKLIPSPWLQGGSVTLASMVPIILISFINGAKWGVLSGFVFSLIQMMTGFYPPPAQNFISFTAVIFLDYIFAFSVLGCADIFKKLTKNKAWSESVAGVIVTALRYFFHILSGILIWGVYAEEGQTVLAYSVIYNGSYMIPEIIITGVVIAMITPIIKKVLK